MLQPVHFVSPAKWSLGHTTWFFEDLILKPNQKHYKHFHPSYSFLFNSYYNTLGKRTLRHERGDVSRPGVEEVYAYRNAIDKRMVEFLYEQGDDPVIQSLVLLGLNHEQQHQELLYSDLKFSFGVNPLFPAYGDHAPCEDKEDETPAWLNVDGGKYEIGFRGDGFCYDNELNPHTVLLQPFSIRNTLVTNGEFLEFIEDRGYQRFEWWHDEALAWLSENKITHPMYWHKREDTWYQFTLAGLRKIQPDAILTHISYYEAAAFAQWKGCRLPTEFEWEAASDRLNWGKRWEYTESAYLPYPGYRRAEGAVGEYNGKFMVNQKVLRGASVVTSEGHSRKTYRNFFHPDSAWQFNGIRLTKDHQ
jgi:ergothioneine biosynthesis protein EgtB